MNADNELLDAQDLFNQLQSNQQMNIIMAQKLNLLHLSLFKNATDIDTSFFDELNEEDCQSLLRLNQVAKKHMFIQIVSEMAKLYNLASSQTQIVNGTIDIKTKTLGRWKSKKFILNLIQKTFEIPRKNKKSKSKKPERIIELQFYSLTHMKFKDTRHRFVLEAMQKNKGYYKSLVCGTADQKTYSTLIEYLKKVSFFKDDTMLSSMVSEEFQGRKGKPRQSEITQKNGPTMTQSVVESSKTRQSQSMAPGQHSIHTQEQQKQQNDFSRASLSVPQQQGRSSEPPRQQQNPVKEQEPPPPPSIKESPSPISPQKPLEIIQEVSEPAQLHNSDLADNSVADEPNKPEHVSSVQPTAQPLQKNRPESPVEDPSPLKQRQDRHQGEGLDNKDDQSSKRQPEEEQKNQLTIQPIIIQDVSPNQQEEQFEEHQDGIPQLFSKLYEDGRLNASYLEKEPLQQFQLVHQGQNLEILRSIQNPLLFRSTITFEGLDQQRVFQAFSEIEFSKKWNGNINANESKYVCLIQSERSAIIYEKRKQYGLFYLPRDYVYLRNVFEKDGHYFIIDKSIENEDCPQYLRVIRGEINYQITRIEKNQYIIKPYQSGTIKVVMETEITNGGFSSLEQDGFITLVYLQELKNVQAFLEKYQVEPIIQSPLLTSLQLHLLQTRRKISFQKVPQKQDSAETPQKSEREPSPRNEVVVVENDIDAEIQRELSIDEQLEQVHSIQHRLSFIPDTGTYRAQQKQDDEMQNEVKNFDQEDDEAKLDQAFADYVPTQVVVSTAQQVSNEYRDRVIQQIKRVEQESYFSNCLNYKNVNEPVNLKQKLLITEAEGGHFFLKKDWERDTKNGGLMFINPKKVEAQKRVIKFMLKKIGSNLLTGKSILSISLPVEIFETRSNLERFAYAFTYGPKYLEEGAQMKTPEDQMKMSITFGLSAINMYLSLEKPFNPILGETYQGFIDGCPVYVEQVSHHPPICAFQLYGRGYKMDGHIESVASMHANSVQGKNVGYIRVSYENTKAIQTYMMVPGIFSGTAFGDRVFNLSGKGFCVDMENSLIWEGLFNPSKSSFFGKKDAPQDYFMGGIYKVKPQAIQKFRKEGYTKFTGLDLNKDIIEKINNTVGIWNEYLEIDQVQTWNLKIFPHQLSNHRNPLPSDSNYRLDILHWKLQDFDNSQKTKEILEVKQRNDQKLREKFVPKKH